MRGWHRSWAAFKRLCARREHRSSVQLLASIKRGKWQEAACQLQAALQLGWTCFFSETSVEGRRDHPGSEGRMRQEYFTVPCEVTHYLSIANWLLRVLWLSFYHPPCPHSPQQNMQNRCIPLFHLYLEISQWQHPCPSRTMQPVLTLQPLWCLGLLH